MKSLPLILGIGIVLLFGVAIAGMVAYPAIRVKALAARLHKAQGERFEETIASLIQSGPDGVAAIENYYRTAKTGWGKPAGGLVARLLDPKPATLGCTGYVEVGIEIRNISTRTVKVESPKMLYNEEKKPIATLGGWGSGGVRRVIVNFPKDIKPGGVHRVECWAEVRREIRTSEKPEKGTRVGVWLQKSNTGGDYDTPELLNPSILVMRSYIKTGKGRDAPKAFTNRVCVKIDPPVEKTPQDR